MATVLQNCVLVRRFKALSQVLQGWTLSFSCALSPHTIPIKQQYEFPHEPSLDIFRSRCLQMNTPLHVLLKADFNLEGNVANDKAELYACHQLCQVSVLQYFWGMACFMDHQYVWVLKVQFYGRFTIVNTIFYCNLILQMRAEVLNSFKILSNPEQNCNAI